MSLITNIQKYSIHDGDGIRTTVFFKGCHLRCVWCHNPETQSFKKELLYDSEKCVGAEAARLPVRMGQLKCPDKKPLPTGRNVRPVGNVRIIATGTFGR